MNQKRLVFNNDNDHDLIKVVINNCQSVLCGKHNVFTQISDEAYERLSHLSSNCGLSIGGIICSFINHVLKIDKLPELIQPSKQYSKGIGRWLIKKHCEIRGQSVSDVINCVLTCYVCNFEENKC